MKTVIYLDILLLVNFLIGYFLLRAAGLLTGAAPPIPRALLGAGAAALSSLALLLPPQPAAVQLLYQLASALAVVRCAFCWRGWQGFVRRALWYALLNMLLAGVVGLGISRYGLRGLHTNNLAVYVNLSPFTLLVCVLGVYLAVRLASLLFGPPQPAGGWQLELELGGKPLRLEALCDTGFFLRDPFSGGQTVLLSYPAVKAQLPGALRGYLDAWFLGESALLAQPPPGLAVRPVLCRTAAGEELLPGIGAVLLRLAKPGRPAQSARATVAFCRRGFEAGGFEALFGSELAAGLG